MGTKVVVGNENERMVVQLFGKSIRARIVGQLLQHKSLTIDEFDLNSYDYTKIKRPGELWVVEGKCILNEDGQESGCGGTVSIGVVTLASVLSFQIGKLI